MRIPIPAWFSKPTYLEWKEYQSRIAFINAFSLQQRHCHASPTLLKTF